MYNANAYEWVLIMCQSNWELLGNRMYKNKYVIVYIWLVDVV